MNKQNFNLSQSGISMDFGRLAVNQLLDTYVQFLDFDSVMSTSETISNFEPIDTLDMTDYILATSEASTKNDTINQYIIKLNKALMQACKKGMTALLVDSEAAAVLGNVEGKFVANPSFGQNLDGVIGNYNKPILL